MSELRGGVVGVTGGRIRALMDGWFGGAGRAARDVGREGEGGSAGEAEHAEGPWDPDDLIVTIEHPMGTVEVPLSEWIARGPGPRERLRPAAVRSRATGESLPVSVIPSQYRNDGQAG